MRSRNSSVLQQIPLPGAWCPRPASDAVERILDRPRSSWSIADDVARTLFRIVESEGATRILEFGAGVSSRILAATLDSLGGGFLTSVEQNPDWCAAEWNEVGSVGTVDGELIRSALVVRGDRYGLYTGWTLGDRIERRGPYDLAFVDAPWGGFGRDGSLVDTFAQLKDGGLVVLDDAWRGREQRTVQRWMLRFPALELVANDGDVGRGLTVLRKLGGVPPGRPGLLRATASWFGSAVDYAATAWCIARFYRSRWRPRAR